MKSISVKKDIQQAQLALGFKTFGVHDERRYVMTVIDAIMGRGMASRLFVEVREKRGLSYDISSRMQFFEDYGMWAITAGLDAKRKDECLKVIEDEIEKLRTTKVTPKELKRIKEYLIGNFKIANEKLSHKMFFYGSTILSFGRLVMPEEQIAGVKKVTAAQILKVAQEVFQDKNKAISWVLPRASYPVKG